MKIRFYTFVVATVLFVVGGFAQESRLQLGFEPETKQVDMMKLPVEAFAAKEYVSESVLASGKFVKIRVRESGLYKVTYETLKSLGLDPANVRVFGYGGALMSQNLLNAPVDDLPEVSIWMEKGSDGQFNAGDYILFYGQGPQKWDYDKSKRQFLHSLNHYSEYGYYFLTSDAGVGKRVEDVDAVEPNPESILYEVNTFDDYAVHEVELVNLGRTGKVFYGEEFNRNRSSYSFNFNFPNILPASLTANVDLAVGSGSATSFSLKLSESLQYTINSPAKNSETYVLGYQINNSIKINNPAAQDALNFTLTHNNAGSDRKAYLNYLALNVRRQLKMSGDVLYFRSSENLGKDGFNAFSLETSQSDLQVWDITDPINIKRMPTVYSNGQLQFTDSSQELKQYVALNPSVKSAFNLEPVSEGVVPNQNIHGMPAADFVIITHPMFLAQAERLAQAHRDVDGLSVNVLTTEQVYNEFSSGTPDATAYRLALKKWYDQTNKQHPKYLLLFGRGSYDNRGIIQQSGDNLVLTYQADNSLDQIKSYVTDDYFGFLADGKGVNITSDILDVGIGRFPVITNQHAKDVVDKMIGYMQNNVRGNWKNELVFVADDGDGGLHMRDMENQVVKPMQSRFPGYQYEKIYLDAYKKVITANGESNPTARNKIQSFVNSGSFMINFMGHAGEHGWTKERVLSTNDVRNMYNDKMPLWVAATCDFVLFDVENLSAGEHVLLNPNGGGIGLFSAARVVYASENARLNNKFVLRLFAKNGEGEYPRLGDAVRQSKNDVGGGTNKLSYMLFGNPALRLSYPTGYSVRTTMLNGNPVQGDEVLKALSVNEFKGNVSDEHGNILNDFNGVVEVVIQDKVQEITTLNNQNSGAITYSDRPNVLYSGKANVINGEFEFTVMIPRDIRYNYGNGRISYYASEDNQGREAQGFYENFVVGGASDNEVDDELGPEVSLYLNEPDFVAGGKVNETPLFVAHISDENGINTVGSGIGHDLKLVIDDSPTTTYILNEYFEADTDSYQSGTVRMKLPELEAGKHILRFYAWDLLNNSTMQTMEFEVVQGLAPKLFGVSNYPNPVKTHTTFVIKHDRPQTILETRLDVYDLTGRIVYQKEQFSADNLVWDLQDNTGNGVNPGVYVYRITINTPNGEMTSKANKIIVVGQ